jgi:hypothetical protein
MASFTDFKLVLKKGIVFVISNTLAMVAVRPIHYCEHHSCGIKLEKVL